MRNRVVQKSTFQDYKFVALPAAIKLFLIGMTVAADDIGEITGEVEWLTENVPSEPGQSEEHVSEWLRVLTKKGHLSEPEFVNGKPLIRITDWNNRNGYTFQYVPKDKVQTWRWRDKLAGPEPREIAQDGVQTNHAGRADAESGEGREVVRPKGVKGRSGSKPSGVARVASDRPRTESKSGVSGVPSGQVPGDSERDQESQGAAGNAGARDGEGVVRRSSGRRLRKSANRRIQRLPGNSEPEQRQGVVREISQDPDKPRKTLKRANPTPTTRRPLKGREKGSQGRLRTSVPGSPAAMYVDSLTNRRNYPHKRDLANFWKTKDVSYLSGVPDIELRDYLEHEVITALQFKELHRSNNRSKHASRYGTYI